MLKPILICLSLLAFSSWGGAEETVSNQPVSNQPQAIEQQLRAGIQDNPQAALPYAQLAAFLLSQGRNGEAVENYQQAIMRDPNNPALFIAIALAYLHDDHHERAMLMVQEALRLDPDSVNGKKLLDYLKN